MVPFQPTRSERGAWARFGLDRVVGIRRGLALVVSVALAGPALGLAAGEETVDSPARVCFDRSAWSGRDRERPCWRVRIYEDGSGVVKTAEGRRITIRSAD
jgi:hypothetical protein